MFVDKSNAANHYSVARDLQTKGKDSEKSGSNEGFGSGQTGDAGPAVVSSLSSAALETSRAVKAADQTSDQNGAGRADEKDASGKSDKPRQSLDVII